MQQSEAYRFGSPSLKWCVMTGGVASFIVTVKILLLFSTALSAGLQLSTGNSGRWACQYTINLTLMKYINNAEDNKSNVDKRALIGAFVDLHSSTLVLEPHHHQFSDLNCSAELLWLHF